jgi:hypothetical protein
LIASGVGVHSNEQQMSAQRQSRREQGEAQSRAENQAVSAQLQEEEALRNENRKTADLSQLMGDEAAGAPGLGGNLLTGVGGVDPNRLNLGRTNVLGG